MRVRPATLSEVPRLVELWVELMDFHTELDSRFRRSPGAEQRWEEYVRGLFEKPSYRVLVGILDDQIAGYLVAAILEYPPIKTVERYGFIQEVAVDPAFRRRGLATSLLDAAEQWLRDCGVGQIEARVEINNAPSQALFREAGFVPRTETLLKICSVE